MNRACEALGISRSRIYRARQPRQAAQERQTPAHVLSLEERVQVRWVIEDFVIVKISVGYIR